MKAGPGNTNKAIPNKRTVPPTTTTTMRLIVFSEINFRLPRLNHGALKIDGCRAAVIPASRLALRC